MKLIIGICIAYMLLMVALGVIAETMQSGILLGAAKYLAIVFLNVMGAVIGLTIAFIVGWSVMMAIKKVVDGILYVIWELR